MLTECKNSKTQSSSMYILVAFNAYWQADLTAQTNPTAL